MRNDTYNRYLRSDLYKEFVSGTKKKVQLFSFHFPSKAKGDNAKLDWIRILSQFLLTRR